MKKIKKVDSLDSLRKKILNSLVKGIPFCQTLGIQVDYLGNEITAHLPFNKEFVGNPAIPALHGGVIGSFLEITAIIQLSWTSFLETEGRELFDKAEVDLKMDESIVRELPKTIDVTIDYLHSGLPLESFARASVDRIGRRYASVSARSWQTDPSKPFAKASGHFLVSKS